MRKTFFPSLLAAICVMTLLGSAAYGQERGHTVAHPNGLVQDWSWHHLVFPQIGPQRSLLALQHDSRAIANWQAAIRRELVRWHFGELSKARSTEHRDWSISLGGGTTAPAMYPAKFTFDINATPDCTTDFIVFPVNVAGSSSQPNLVAFNNLYSGTAPGPTGICNRTPNPGVDDGISATTLWSYNIDAIGGAIATSPALSLDGTKVAVVESAPGVPAHFHVLAYNATDGQDATNLQNVLLPATISNFSTTAPAAGSGTATDLVLGSTSADTNTLSSPFVDYARDLAYVGNDNGTLFRVRDVFCTNDPGPCSGATPPAPSLDATWGTAGALAVCPGFQMTAAVVDNLTGHIFVGCSDGNLYGFTFAGVAISSSSVNVGDGSTPAGGIVDAPIIDPVNGFVYVTTGSGAVTGTGAVVQASTVDFGGQRIARVGAGGVFNVHSPAFNDAYFSSAIPANWLLYVVGLNNAGSLDAVYGVTFSATHVMQQGAPTHTFAVSGSTPAEFSPLTEFLNGGTDQLFVSALTTVNPNFIEFNINTFPTSFPATNTFEGNGITGGTSGIIVDNAAAVNQASSVYFGAAGTNTAVKLTQNGLD